MGNTISETFDCFLSLMYWMTSIISVWVRARGHSIPTHEMLLSQSRLYDDVDLNVYIHFTPKLYSAQPPEKLSITAHSLRFFWFAAPRVYYFFQ